MLILPATAGDGRRVHRGRRGGARDAVDDRQRHALPADAVRPGRAPRAGRDPRADVPRRRRRGRRAGDGAVPRPGDADRRHAQARCPTRDVRARRTPTTTRSRPSRNLFVDAIDRTLAATILEHLEASDAPMRVAQLRVLGGAMARVAGGRHRVRPPRAPDHGQRRRVLRPADEDRRRARRGSTAFAAALRGDDRGAYVNFLDDEGAERVRDAYPARDLGPARRDQGAATTRRTCSGATRTSRRRPPDDQGRPHAHLLGRRGGDAGVPARRAAAGRRSRSRSARRPGRSSRPARASWASTRRRAAAARRRTRRRATTRSR